MMMGARSHARMVFMASLFAIAASTLPVAAQFAAAQPVHQTGPNGSQCHLKGMDGDMVAPDQNDKTKNANISLSGGLSTAPDMHVAGCDLVAAPPVVPPTVPPGVPVRKPSLLATIVGNAAHP
jgi:hypothetical protein